MNGIVLDPSDFTATNGTSVVLASGAALNDIVNIYAFKSFTTADMVSKTNGGTFAGNVNFSGNIDVDGTTDLDGLTVDGNLSVDGGTIKLDGNYPTGTGNVALGDAALDDGSLSGGFNTAIGNAALGANTTGQQNVAVGQNTADAVTTGNSNVAVGAHALGQTTTGSNNTAVGHNALTANTTASSNTAMGHNCLTANTTGTNNACFGRDAGERVTTGSQNTLIGDNAGENVTTPNNNTFIGRSAGSLITTGADNTIIGRYNGNAGGLDIRTSDNNIVLSDGDGSVRLRATAQGSVIIPGNGGASGDNPAGSNCSLTVYRDGSTLRVAHFHNEQNTSGAENLRAVLESNCNNSSSYYFIGTISGSGDKIYIYGNGNIQNANNSYGAFSDIKLKENISDAASQWDDIKALQVKKYSLIEDDLDAANKLGVIAQDLEASGMSGLVETLDDKDEEGLLTGTQTKSVKYSVLYMKAVKALQEAMTRIETLETKVAALENAE